MPFPQSWLTSRYGRQAKGKEILKHPQRAQSAATMREVVQNTAALRQGQADAELALQVRTGLLLVLVLFYVLVMVLVLVLELVTPWRR